MPSQCGCGFAADRFLPDRVTYLCSYLLDMAVNLSKLLVIRVPAEEALIQKSSLVGRRD